jgi:hypothetical protein
VFTYAVASDPRVAGYAMVSDRFLAVLGAAAGDATAATLWHLLTGDEPTLASVLATLEREAPEGLSDMAIIELVDVPSKSVAVAVRGAARVELDGDGDSNGPQTHDGAGSWSRTGAHEVSGMTLRLASPGASFGTLPLARGIVRSDRLEWGLPPASEPPTATIRRERATTDDPGVEDRTELSHHVRHRAAPPVLIVDDDDPLSLAHPVVLGRSPRAAEHPGARLVTLSSPLREISSGHLEVHLDGDTLVARDLDSTNGTIIATPDGSRMLLRQGAQMRVPVGSSLDLGEGHVAIFAPAPLTAARAPGPSRRG